MALRSILAVTLAALASATAASASPNVSISTGNPLIGLAKVDDQRNLRLGKDLDPTAGVPPGAEFTGSFAALLRQPVGAQSSNHTAPYNPLTINSSGWYKHRYVGRLYYPNGQGFCSGTLVDRNLVLTAAHCLYWTDGFPSGVQFAIGQWGAEASGTWTMRPNGIWMKQAWIDSVDIGVPYMPFDYAFVVLQPDAAGRSAGDVHGWASIVTEYVGDVWSLGYPSKGWFGTWGGNYPFFVWSPYGGYSTSTYGTLTGYEIGMGNYMTGGASGGPWFVNYNGSWDYVASVNSHCEPGGCAQNDALDSFSRNMWGPYFDEEILNLFNEARRS